MFGLSLQPVVVKRRKIAIVVLAVVFCGALLTLSVGQFQPAWLPQWLPTGFAIGQGTTSTAIKPQGINIHASTGERLEGVDCGDCHFGPQPTHDNPAVRATTKAACLRCHNEIAAKTRTRYVHQPLTAEECTLCHVVHHTDTPNQLIASPSELCAKCHDSVAAEETAQVQHPPFANGECGDCHDAHGSDRAVLLKSEQVCWTCHQNVAERDTVRQYQHAPFANGDCAACHQAHATDYPDLLATDVGANCRKCHPDALDRMRTSHTPAVKGQCTSCHDAHASDLPAMIVAPGRVLCETCHRLSS